jgi:hypothetical protein
VLYITGEKFQKLFNNVCIDIFADPFQIKAVIFYINSMCIWQFLCSTLCVSVTKKFRIVGNDMTAI